MMDRTTKADIGKVVVVLVVVALCALLGWAIVTSPAPAPSPVCVSSHQEEYMDPGDNINLPVYVLTGSVMWGVVTAEKPHMATRTVCDEYR